MFGDDLRLRMTSRQQLRRIRVKSEPLGGFQQVVDGDPDDPVRECHRVGGLEKRSENEFFGGGGTAVRLQTRELDGIA